MKKYIFLIVVQSFTSCMSQDGPTLTTKEKNEIQDFFGVKGNVKEIHTETEALTTAGKANYSTTTSFNKNGAPIETKMYENGKFEKTEPWRLSNKEDEKGWELIEKFDSKKRLQKTIKYNDGRVVAETEFKYDDSSNKIEEFEKISQLTRSFKYNNLGKLTEEIEYGANRDDWRSKKTYSYNDKANSIEMLIYYYPNDKTQSGKIIKSFDAKGSLIKSITYDKENTVIENIVRKITYY